MLALGLALCPEGAVHVYSNNSYLLHRLSNEFNLNHARISKKQIGNRNDPKKCAPLLLSLCIQTCLKVKVLFSLTCICCFVNVHFQTTRNYANSIIICFGSLDAVVSHKLD